MARAREPPHGRVGLAVGRVEAFEAKLSIVKFGQGFVFWRVDTAVADGFLDPVANAAVVEATRRAFGDDPELIDNTRRYGYSLVGQRYVPHITLGLDSRPDDAPAARPADAAHAHTMVGDRIVVAPLGAYGQIDVVYSLD